MLDYSIRYRFRMFNFSAAEVQAQWHEMGYCFVRNGCDSSLLTKLIKRYELIVAGGDSPELYEFLPDSALLQYGVETLKQLTSSKHLTVSRKNIMYYRKGMHSPAHKDRKSLQYAVAIGVNNPFGSRLLLWPDANRDVNVGNHYRIYTEKMGSQEEVDAYLSTIEPVSLATNPGDVVIFPGNSMFHQRVNPLKACVYYLDFNEWGIDDRNPSMQERPSP